MAGLLDFIGGAGQGAANAAAQAQKAGLQQERDKLLQEYQNKRDDKRIAQDEKMYSLTQSDRQKATDLDFERKKELADLKYRQKTTQDDLAYKRMQLLEKFRTGQMNEREANKYSNKMQHMKELQKEGFLAPGQNTAQQDNDKEYRKQMVGIEKAGINSDNPEAVAAARARVMELYGKSQDKTVSNQGFTGDVLSILKDKYGNKPNTKQQTQQASVPEVPRPQQKQLQRPAENNWFGRANYNRDQLINKYKQSFINK